MRTRLCTEYVKQILSLDENLLRSDESDSIKFKTEFLKWELRRVQEIVILYVV